MLSEAGNERCLASVSGRQLADILITSMYYILRFLWNATRGHRLTPWRSPYLRWRIETYTGIKMQSIGFLEFLDLPGANEGSYFAF